MRTWSSIAFIIGCILFIFGISIYTSSDYGLPPVPAGWVLAICILILSGAMIFSGITMFIHYDIKQRAQWFMVGLIGIGVGGLGIRTIILHPYETPECLCAAGFYGTDCLPCTCVNGICNDGNNGNGVCFCNNGWDGANCDVCASTFQGDNCDECKRGWDTNTCDVCYPGYIGSNCDICHPNWLSEVDIFGTLCRRCKPGFWGASCKSCPTCNTDDPGGFCRDNDWWRDNRYDSNACESTGFACENDFDCSSSNCKGQCIVEDQFTGQFCENDLECTPGTCEAKTCCLQNKYGDGVCECTRNGYWGPLCQPCPGFDGIYSASICTGHGTCAASYVKDNLFSHLTCECAPEGDSTWAGGQCGCLEKDGECTQCADGFFGSNCTVCPGGGGISQCSLHGKCSDGLGGDGTCTCDLDIKPNGLGGWKTSDTKSCDVCFSDKDFKGDQCQVCRSTKEVGFEDRSDGLKNTELPNGNFLSTCPRDNSVCTDNRGCT